MSADPWTHGWLMARVDEHVTAWLGQRVRVHRYMQTPIVGELLRGDKAHGSLILSGFGVVPVDQIERIESAASSRVTPCPHGRPCPPDRLCACSAVKS